jgi:hypothetical protein
MYTNIVTFEMWLIKEFFLRKFLSKISSNTIDIKSPALILGKRKILLRTTFDDIGQSYQNFVILNGASMIRTLIKNIHGRATATSAVEENPTGALLLSTWTLWVCGETDPSN